MIGWRILGGIAFALGGIGLVVPIWPTTVFWIIAAVAFAKSNPKMADWIYARPGIGAPIQVFVETGRLNRTTKIAAIAGMLAAGALIGFALWHHRIYLIAAWTLIAVGAAYVLSRKAP